MKSIKQPMIVLLSSTSDLVVGLMAHSVGWSCLEPNRGKLASVYRLYIGLIFLFSIQCLRILWFRGLKLKFNQYYPATNKVCANIKALSEVEGKSSEVIAVPSELS